MGIFDKFKKNEHKAGSREAKERCDQMLNQMIGISGRAKLSSKDHPVCFKCGYEFPWSAKYIEENSPDKPFLICPECDTKMTL